MEIRPVRSGDIIGITRVVLSARGFRGQELEKAIEFDLARFRQAGITELIESETLIATDSGRMVGVLRYGEFEEDVHVTRPDLDPSVDAEQVTEAFLRAFWHYMSPQANRALYLDYPVSNNKWNTLGAVFEQCGFAKLVDRMDMRLQLTQPIPDANTDAGANPLTFASYDAQTHERFFQAFQASFQGSLDPMMEWDAKHPQESFTIFRERFGQFEPSTWVLATDASGTDVGFALFQHFQGGRYHNDTVLLYMAVLPEARGHGYGEELVREGLRRIRNLRGPQAHVSLTVSKPNTPAIKIYQKLGFTPVEAFSVYRMSRT
ncbi:MAG: GNAT family N-acetyltransferase [Tumebacillaceae bacterium]